MKVLVIGGSGFLGSHIVDKFRAKGCHVSVLDRTIEHYRRELPGVKYILGDIGNRGQVEAILKQSFDIIVHSVSSTTPKTSNEDPEFDIQSNVIESVNFLQACAQHKVKKVIYLSSGGTVYGNSNSEYLSESDPVLPICSYAISKLSIENYLGMFKVLYGLDYVALRISNPYGPRQNPKKQLGAISVFLDRALLGQTIEVWGDGKVVRDFVYVSDVAQAVFLAAQTAVSGVYNIGSGEGISITGLIEEIRKAINRDTEVTYMPRRSFDVRRVVLDCSKAERDFGWRPATSLCEGVKETADWMTWAISQGLN